MDVEIKLDIPAMFKRVLQVVASWRWLVVHLDIHWHVHYRSSVVIIATTHWLGFRLPPSWRTMSALRSQRLMKSLIFQINGDRALQPSTSRSDMRAFRSEYIHLWSRSFFLCLLRCGALRRVHPIFVHSRLCV